MGNFRHVLIVGFWHGEGQIQRLWAGHSRTLWSSSFLRFHLRPLLQGSVVVSYSKNKTICFTIAHVVSSVHDCLCREHPPSHCSHLSPVFRSAWPSFPTAFLKSLGSSSVLLEHCVQMSARPLPTSYCNFMFVFVSLLFQMVNFLKVKTTLCTLFLRLLYTSWHVVLH